MLSSFGDVRALLNWSRKFIASDAFSDGWLSRLQACRPLVDFAMSDRYNPPNLQIGDIAQRCWFAILVICQSRREDGLSRGSFRKDDNDREMIR